MISFYIPKGKGYRKITTYKTKESGLYRFHTNANISLNKRLKQSIFAKAYKKGNSIITNARAHMYNDVFISLDIEKFFQNINHKKLQKILYYEINKNYIQHFSKEQCGQLIKSCSNSNKGLAIGLKPSPILANIYLKEFDGKLYGWLKKTGVKNPIYTRYADDMMISYKGNNFESDISSTITAKVKELLSEYGLSLNCHKTRIINLNVSNHVKITGINITKNENNYRQLTVGRKLKNNLYYRAINVYKQIEMDSDLKNEIKKIRGLQSFVLSVEGEKYEEIYSKQMLEVIKNFGYHSLKEMIDSWKIEK